MLLELECVPVSGLPTLRCAVLNVDRLLEFRWVLHLLNNFWWQSEVLKMVKVTSATIIWCPTRQLYLLWIFAPGKFSRLSSTGVQWMEGVLYAVPIAVGVTLLKVCLTSVWWSIAELLHSVPNS
jgi:hypothetical protein